VEKACATSIGFSGTSETARSSANTPNNIVMD